jgi:AcrR family transcriptional regulator
MREVAAEAGVSLRLVQYYFGTKEELLLAAMQQLAAQFSDRAMARIRQSRQDDGPASPRDVIAAILTEALPADGERRIFTLVYTAYLALSLTDPALAISPLARNSNAVSDVIAAQLRAAQADGDMPAGLDPAPCRGAAGEVADRRGSGLLALAGAVDDVASLVNRSAVAARLGPGDGGVPGPGQAVSEPGANLADELAGRPRQRVAVAAVAPG